MGKQFRILLSGVILFSFAYSGCSDKDQDDITAETVETTIDYLPDGYESLFTHGVLHNIEIVFSQGEWDGLIKDLNDYEDNKPIMFTGGSGNYRRAKFIYNGPAGEVTIDNVGFRTKGRTSRVIPQDDDGDFHRAHFKVKFNKTFNLVEGTEAYERRKDRRFCKLRKLIFRLQMDPGFSPDKSQVRELYCYDIMNRAGVNLGKTGSARLTITIGGVKHYFGVYTLIEPVDKSFLTKRYGKDGNDGYLFKCLTEMTGPATLEYSRMINSGYIIGIKDWENYYRPTYDLKTNEDELEQAKTELLSFAENLNNLTGDDLKEYLDANFEVDKFARYLAMNILVGKEDDYWAMGNNYHLYFNNNGKIEFFPNDYDMALHGGLRIFETLNYFDDSIPYLPDIGIYEWQSIQDEFLCYFIGICYEWNYTSPLVDKIFEIDEYRAMYENYLIEFMTPSNNLFVYSDYEARFNTIYSLYSPHLDNDIDEYEKMINEEVTRNYFHNRTSAVVNELRDVHGYGDLNPDDFETGAP